MTLTRWWTPAVVGAALLGCERATEPRTPAGPSPQAIVTYEAGGSIHVSGGYGTWCNWRTIDTSLHILSMTATATPVASGDSARPAVAFVSFYFRGLRFEDLPADFSQRLGVSGADTAGSSAGTVNVRYVADSGTIRLRRLGGGYARIDFEAWYSPMYVPA